MDGLADVLASQTKTLSCKPCCLPKHSSHENSVFLFLHFPLSCTEQSKRPSFSEQRPQMGVAVAAPMDLFTAKPRTWTRFFRSHSPFPALSKDRNFFSVCPLPGWAFSRPTSLARAQNYYTHEPPDTGSGDSYSWAVVIVLV